MKSKSPFSKNTPLNKIEIFQGSTSTYRHPSTVIQPIVGAQVGKKLAEVGSKVAVDAINAKADKKSDGGTMIDSKGLQIPTRKDNLPKPDMKLPNLTGNSKSTSGRGRFSGQNTSTTTTGGKSYRQAYAEAGRPGETYSQYVARAEKWHKDNPGNRPSSTTKTTNTSWEQNFEIKDGQFVTTAANMNGSPAKQIDPYAAINPEAVPGAQAQNVLGAQPIVGADLNQARNVDMQAMIDPYKSPGATFKPGEKLKAENIYGQAGQRQALMNLGSPMHAHTPTHGKKYKKGDLIDESDFEALGTGYNVQNISDIQEDKKGQFMTTLGDSEIYSDRPRPKSKKIDYPDPKGSVRDTIRPKVGKFFKRS